MSGERPFARPDLERHHLAYDEGGARRFLERLLLALPADPAALVAHAKLLIATGIAGNVESSARLLLAAGDAAPTALLEETLAGEDAALRLEVILALKRRGRRFYDPEIFEYILSHEGIDERLRMARRFAESCGGGEPLFREIIAGCPPDAFTRLAECLLATGMNRLCGDLRAAAEAKGVSPSSTLLFFAASLGCPTAIERLERESRAASGDPARADAHLCAILDLMIRVGPARIPDPPLLHSIPLLVDPFQTLEGERLHLLASIAALKPAPLAAFSSRYLRPEIPDLAFLGALADGGPEHVDPADLPHLTARGRAVGMAALGDLAFADPATHARLLDAERGSPGFARVAEAAPRLHAARRPEPLLETAARILDDGPAGVGLEPAADLAALLFAGGRLARAAVDRCLAAFGRAARENALP